MEIRGGVLGKEYQERIFSHLPTSKRNNLTQLLGSWRLGRLQFYANLVKKSVRVHLDKMLDVVEHACNPSYTRGIGQKIVVQGKP
jgi:hypothetical protein